jgi:hypothetical protein
MGSRGESLVSRFLELMMAGCDFVVQEFGLYPVAMERRKVVGESKKSGPEEILAEPGLLGEARSVKRFLV